MVLGAISAVGDEQAVQMSALQDRQRALVVQKQQLNKEIKNEQRKKARLVTKAKTLTNEDLVSILACRAAATAKAKAKAKAKGA